MAHDIFVVETEMARTPSGLILPNRRGMMVAAIGTMVTEEMYRMLAGVSDASIEPYEAAVLLAPDVFKAAAQDFLRIYGRTALGGEG